MRRLLHTVVVLATLLASRAAVAGGPVLSFGPGGVTFEGLRPGTQVAWMALVRMPVRDHVGVRLIRGSGPATPSGSLTVEHPGADHAQAIWAAVDLESGSGVRVAAPTFQHSRQTVPIAAIPGQSAFVVGAPSVSIMYVRPRKGIWAVDVADGAAGDADRMQDGQIVIALSGMVRDQGNPHPPEYVEPGDLIIAIDGKQLRTGQLEVAR